jgi:hypothetical protein
LDSTALRSPISMEAIIVRTESLNNYVTKENP